MDTHGDPQAGNQSEPPAVRRRERDPVAIATLVGVVLVLGVTLATSFANLRDMRRLESGVAQRLQKVETQLAQLAARPTQASPAQQGPDPTRVHSIDTSKAPVRGPIDAPITIAEFSDFQCPYCAKVNPVLREVEQRYGATVRVVWKHLPIPTLHKDAVASAMAAEAARNQSKFWEYHDKLFANQSKLGPEDLKRYAKELGLDMKRFEEDLLNSDSMKRLETDLNEATRLGLRATPAFFINGRYLRGAAPFETFARLIDEELRRLNLPVPAKPEGN